MDKLKPCPWCGKIPIRNEEINLYNNKKYYWIACENYKCSVQPSTASYVCKGADIRAWNRRINNENN